MKTHLIQFLVPFLIVHTVLNAQNLSKEKNMPFPKGFNVCDPTHIFNSDYQYSLPESLLKGFLSGKAFDNSELYTENESTNLHADINEIFQEILDKKPVQEKWAIITAGAPGAGKTIKIEQDLEKNALEGKNYAYICPDSVCLKKQKRTYQADVADDKSPENLLKAYNKWRPGSNAATHLILGNLIRENYAFYFGSTSSSPQTGKFFEFLKKQGYKIKLIHVSASDEVRWKSIQKRDEGFVQTTAEDVSEKGLLLPQRIHDTFLKYADEIEFYSRDDAESDAILAARWLRNEDDSNFEGTLEILDKKHYENIKLIHNTSLAKLNKPELQNLNWEQAVEAKSKILDSTSVKAL